MRDVDFSPKLTQTLALSMETPPDPNVPNPPVPSTRRAEDNCHSQSELQFAELFQMLESRFVADVLQLHRQCILQPLGKSSPGGNAGLFAKPFSGQPDVFSAPASVDVSYPPTTGPSSGLQISDVDGSGALRESSKPTVVSLSTTLTPLSNDDSGEIAPQGAAASKEFG
eukprot:CAMPEP_0169300848 /NCGR_PEP_ID=MMETSP1016-20121227/67908_1 /TAXON_ID=342587 /ORGANISM="Karlodinium micrum, Strain CCMP2283" /LENGTH=168 /DNA_ID=CAMNT_0009393365 /DNA_START=30 /DNA_END=533 /DNA_ORIENTATION=-